MSQLVREYSPKAYLIRTDGEDIDVDGSNDGDYIVCNIHPDIIVYVLGTGFWSKEGGAGGGGWSSIKVQGYCHKCREHKAIYCGSYGG